MTSLFDRLPSKALVVAITLGVGTSIVALLAPAIALDLFILCLVVLVVAAQPPAKRWPTLLGATACLGLYLPTGIGSIDLPVVVPATALAAATIAARGFHPAHVIRGWIMVPFTCLVGGLVIGVVHGPAPSLGFRPLAVIAWLALVTWTSAQLARQGQFETLLRWYSGAAAVFGVVNLCFFLFPAVEDAYFASWVSHVFVEPDSVRKLLTGDTLNNALSHGKAATLYINANVAAMFFGTAAWAAYGSWQRSAFRAPLVAACLVGALGTASRGGALGGIVSLFAWTVLRIDRRKLGRVLGQSAVIAVGVGILGLVVSQLHTGGFSRFAWDVVSSDPRLLLWASAVKLGSLHPILGGGFGAWEAYWPPIAQVVNLRPSFPPHNVYLYLWILGGAPAAIGFLLIGVMILVKVREFGRGTAGSAVPSVLAIGAIVAWMWTQANFENLFFLEYRLGFLISVLIGNLLAIGAPDRSL